MSNIIYILVTMDVEPVLEDRPPGATGPLNYDDSERSVRAFAGLAADFGCRVSLMIHPEAARAHPRTFHDLAEDGACLGLHLHPWKFADGHYRSHLGALSADQQCALLSEAIAMWYSGLGTRPRYFRPGTCSANDSTYGVLEDLGFVGGSVSLPGRVLPDLCSVWAGAELDPHRAHRTFRQLSGDLNFVNIPLSVDTSSVQIRGNRSFHWDLRAEWDNADYSVIATNIVSQVQKRAPVVPVVHLITHNDHDFEDSADPACRNLHKALETVWKACSELGVKPVGATFTEVTDLVRSCRTEQKEFVAADVGTLKG